MQAKYIALILAVTVISAFVGVILIVEKVEPQSIEESDDLDVKVDETPAEVDIGEDEEGSDIIDQESDEESSDVQEPNDESDTTEIIMQWDIQNQDYDEYPPEPRFNSGDNQQCIYQVEEFYEQAYETHERELQNIQQLNDSYQAILDGQERYGVELVNN